MTLVSGMREDNAETNVDRLIEIANARHSVEPETAAPLVESSLQQAEDFVRTL